MKFKSILFVLSFILIFWVFIPNYLIDLNIIYGLPEYRYGFLNALGYILIGIGVLINVNISYLFMKFGKGTPSITEPTKKLVQRGIYKYTRNPMYLSNTTIILGIFCIYGHVLILLYAAIFFKLMHLFLVFIEEPSNRKKFGKSYEKYLQEVPRWF